MKIILIANGFAGNLPISGRAYQSRIKNKFERFNCPGSFFSPQNGANIAIFANSPLTFIL